MKNTIKFYSDDEKAFLSNIPADEPVDKYISTFCKRYPGRTFNAAKNKYLAMQRKLVKTKSAAHTPPPTKVLVNTLKFEKPNPHRNSYSKWEDDIIKHKDPGITYAQHCRNIQGLIPGRTTDALYQRYRTLNPDEFKKPINKQSVTGIIREITNKMSRHFTTGDFIREAKTLNIADSTAEKWLFKYQGTCFYKLRNGHFERIYSSADIPTPVKRTRKKKRTFFKWNKTHEDILLTKPEGMSVTKFAKNLSKTYPAFKGVSISAISNKYRYLMKNKEEEAAIPVIKKETTRTKVTAPAKLHSITIAGITVKVPGNSLTLSAGGEDIEITW